jgi:large subunit ribosomal protein L7/L12
MSKIETIMEQLQALTLLEAAELVKEIEETFGVDASVGGGMMMMAGPAGDSGGEDAAEEKTEFDIFLAEVPADKKIAILKVVRGITGLGLKEAKEMVEAAPKVVAEGLGKDAAEEAKKSLEEAGAKVELK